MTRRTLARIVKGAAAQGPELLPRKLISAKAAARILGVGQRESRLRGLGLTPVESASQETAQGRLTFRAYAEEDVLRVRQEILSREREKRAGEELLRLARLQAQKKPRVDPAAPFFRPESDTPAGPTGPTGQTSPTGPTPMPPASPETHEKLLRQLLGVNCEIRDLLKRRTA